MERTFHSKKWRGQHLLLNVAQCRAHSSGPTRFRSFSDLPFMTRPPGNRWGRFLTHVWPQKEPVKCRKVK